MSLVRVCIVRRDHFNSRSVHVEQLVSEVFVFVCVLMFRSVMAGVWSSCILHSSFDDHMTTHLISTLADWLFISLVLYSITFLFIVSLWVCFVTYLLSLVLRCLNLSITFGMI